MRPDTARDILLALMLLAALAGGFILGCKATALAYPCVIDTTDAKGPK